MATTVESRVRSTEGERRFVVYNVGWEGYQILLKLLGDHGLMCKGPFHYEGLLRVPMIWRWPGRFPQGRMTDALVGLVDFAATVLDLAGVPIPGDLLTFWVGSLSHRSACTRYRVRCQRELIRINRHQCLLVLSSCIIPPFITGALA